MLRIVDILQAAAKRVQRDGLPSSTGDNRSEEENRWSQSAHADAISARDPLTMTRGAVQLDLDRMLTYYGAGPNERRMHRAELIDAEDVCAHCEVTERCRRWFGEGRQGDAPSLFCANSAAIEAMTSDPFWIALNADDAHHDQGMSPVSHLLFALSPGRRAAKPALHSDRLQAFAETANRIDRLIEQAAFCIDAAGSRTTVHMRYKRLLLAIEAVLDEDNALTKADFGEVFMVSLCDHAVAYRIGQFMDQAADGPALASR